VSFFSDVCFLPHPTGGQDMVGSGKTGLRGISGLGLCGSFTMNKQNNQLKKEYRDE
jgi:hypothetical protein